MCLIVIKFCVEWEKDGFSILRKGSLVVDGKRKVGGGNWGLERRDEGLKTRL